MRSGSLPTQIKQRKTTMAMTKTQAKKRLAESVRTALVAYARRNPHEFFAAREIVSRAADRAIDAIWRDEERERRKGIAS